MAYKVGSMLLKYVQTTVFCALAVFILGEITAWSQDHDHQSDEIPGSRIEAGSASKVERGLAVEDSTGVHDALSVHVGEISSHIDELRRIQEDLGNPVRTVGSAKAAEISRLQAALQKTITSLDALKSLIDETDANNFHDIIGEYSKDIEQTNKEAEELEYILTEVFPNIVEYYEHAINIEAEILEEIAYIKSTVNEIVNIMKCCSELK